MPKMNTNNEMTCKGCEKTLDTPHRTYTLPCGQMCKGCVEEHENCKECDEVYGQPCAVCRCRLTENVHIFCMSRKKDGDEDEEEEETICSDCFFTNMKEYKEEGWLVDGDDEYPE